MSDVQRAQEYLIDPLNAPEPSQETGPGTHFGSTFAGKTSSKSSASLTPPGSAKIPSAASKNPFRTSVSGSKSDIRDNVVAVGASNYSYPSPPDSATNSPSQRKNPFQHSSNESRERQSLDSPRRQHHQLAHRPRGNSLGTRFPGDESNKPLDIIRRESKRANRSPHISKRHIPGADMIDRLDASVPGKAYHHEGPFDATLLARNTDFKSSPVAAVRGTHIEVLKATPQENVQDALERHRPLDGVAFIPPGEQDRFGRTYDYQEGENLMVDLGGNYKRWPGVDYHPDDIKGKGEPQYSIDRARKAAKQRQEAHGPFGTDSDDVESQDIELIEQVPHSKAAEVRSVGHTTAADTMTHSSDSRGEMFGESSNGPDSEAYTPGTMSHLGGLKRRFGSLRKRLD